VTRHI